MKIKHTYIAFLTILHLLVVIHFANAQVIIIPDYSGSALYSANQGFNVRLLNTGSSTIEGYLHVRIVEATSQSQLQLRSDLISLDAGATITNQNISWDGGYDIQSNSNATIINETVHGQYSFCYRFVQARTGKQLGNYCREMPISRLARPELIYPLDGQILSNRYPIFSWRPPLPIPPGHVSYNLKVVKLDEGQSPIDGINANYPMIEKYGIRSNSFPYPLAGIPLENGETYAWQVQVMQQQNGIGETQIWEFTIPQELQIINIEASDESYRGIKQSLDGSFYVFTENIYLSFDNKNYHDTLNYRIWEKSNKEQIIIGPIISLVPGQNNIKLEVGNQLSLNKHYVLEIQDLDKSYYLEFKKIPKSLVP